MSAATASTGPRGSGGGFDKLSHRGSDLTEVAETTEVPEATEVPEPVEGTGASAAGAATEVPEPVEGTGASAAGVATEVPEPVEGAGAGAPGVATEVPEPVEGTGASAPGAATEVPEPVEGTGTHSASPVPILQPGVGPIPGDHYLRATPDTVLWGRLPCATDTAVLEIASGQSVTFDTVSHEGILDDQGKDPAVYFAGHGVPRAQVLDDAVEIAASVTRDPFADGPHVVVGPVHVAGAHPGDLLKITIESLVPRVPYGVISNRHGKGALVGELPRGEHNVSVFAAVAERGGILHGTLPIVEGGEPVVAFPLAPFLGTMGVAVAGEERPHSVPPGTHGGNIDINLLVEGTTLFLPVQVEGALAYVGDPHFAQGDGEVALTALEASLRATLRFEVIPADAARAAFGEVTGPLVRTPDYLVPTGMDPDLDAAMRACVRSSLALLRGRWGVEEHLGYAYLSAATDFDISQVVDIVSGVHARIREADFAAVPSVEPESIVPADGGVA